MSIKVLSNISPFFGDLRPKVARGLKHFRKLLFRYRYRNIVFAFYCSMVHGDLRDLEVVVFVCLCEFDGFDRCRCCLSSRI